MNNQKHPRTFLVIIDNSVELPVALRYACRRAREVQGRVAMLYVVEPDAIEAWGGVERALTDDAFDQARKEMASYEKMATELSGAKPITFYRKGVRRDALIDLIDQEEEISVLILAALTSESGTNPLIKYLTSEKGLRRLRVPLVIVPETCRSSAANQALG